MGRLGQVFEINIFSFYLLYFFLFEDQLQGSPSKQSMVWLIEMVQGVIHIDHKMFLNA